MVQAFRVAPFEWCLSIDAGLSTVFLEPQNGFFWVGCIYGRNDDASRFSWFCGAAAEYIRTSDLGYPCFLTLHPASRTR